MSGPRIPMMYRAMGRSIAGKSSVARTRRQKRLAKARAIKKQLRKKQQTDRENNTEEHHPVVESKFGAFESEDAYYYEYYRRLDEEQQTTQQEQVLESEPDLEPDLEPDSDENEAVGDTYDLALEVAHQFLMGEEWQRNITSFIHQNCSTFTYKEMQEGKFDHQHHTVWNQFRDMVELKVSTILRQLGLEPEMLAARCRRVLRTRGSLQRRHASEVVRSLLVIDDFSAFCSLVIQLEEKRMDTINVPLANDDVPLVNDTETYYETKNNAVDQQIDLIVQQDPTLYTFSCTKNSNGAVSLGMELISRVSGGGCIVRNVETDSFAEKNGVKRGHVIMYINNCNVERYELSQVINLLKGIENNGDPSAMTIVLRKRIAVSVSANKDSTTTDSTPSSTDFQRLKSFTMTKEECHHLFDLPSDWFQQIKIATAIMNKKQKNKKELKYLLPWATASKKLDAHNYANNQNSSDSTTINSTLSPEEILQLRFDVFIKRIDVDLYVAKQMLRDVYAKTTESTATTEADVLMMKCLERQSLLENEVIEQRNVVLSTNQELNIHENMYGDIYLYLQTALRKEQNQENNLVDDPNVSSKMNETETDGRDVIPQRASSIVPKILKLLVLEAEKEHIINTIRNTFENDSLKVPTTTPTSFSSKTNDIDGENDESDAFLDSIRYLKGKVMLAC